MTEPVAGRLVYAPTAVEHALDLTACQPYILQSLCREVFSACKRDAVRSVTTALVEDCAKRVAPTLPHFKHVFDSDAETDRKRYLIAVTNVGGSDLTVASYQQRLERDGIGTFRLGDDLDDLVDEGILTRRERGGETSYRLRTPMMAYWLERRGQLRPHHPARPGRQRAPVLTPHTMSDTPYRIHGATPPPCLGRRSVLDQIAEAFDAADPSNVSVYGPKYIGKSVLLREVATRYGRPENEGSPFDGVVYWDLRHAGVTDQDSFYHALAGTLADAVAPFDTEAASLLRGNQTWDATRLVASSMADEGQRVLVVMDNFDALMRANIPQGAWENLRHLHAEIGSVYYLVGSRSSLSDLCAVDQEGYDLSDFPRIFDANVELRAFDSGDGEPLRAPLADQGVTLAKGAVTEAERTTGGVPILTALLYGRLHRDAERNATVDHTGVQAAASALAGGADLPRTLKELWRDCTDDGRQALAALAQPDGLGSLRLGAGVTATVAADLVTRGYAARKGDGIVGACGWMTDHAREHGQAATAVHQLFGTAETYEEFMPTVLALRLGQTDWDAVETVAPGLRRKAEHIVEHADEPEIMAAQVRAFVNPVLDAVTNAICPTGQVPQEMTDKMELRDSRSAYRGAAPTEGGRQIGLLRQVTDSRYGFDTRVSRATYVLLSYLHGVGNEGQHLKSELRPTLGHSVALAVASVCDRVADELTVPARQ